MSASLATNAQNSSMYKTSRVSAYTEHVIKVVTCAHKWSTCYGLTKIFAELIGKPRIVYLEIPRERKRGLITSNAASQPINHEISQSGKFSCNHFSRYGGRV
jgi:hypothetical protein